MGTLVYDRSVRQAVIQCQRRRLRDFSPERIAERLEAVLSEVAVR
jgi:hypothetical protein